MRDPVAFDTLARSGSTARRGGLLALALLLLGFTAINSVSCVKTGHVGVVTVFGRITGRTLPEGIHVVSPLARVQELDIKTQEIKERTSVPSSEGLIMGIEASVLYHLQPDRAADVLQKIGTGYAEVLLIPNFRSAIRTVTAVHTDSRWFVLATKS